MAERFFLDTNVVVYTFDDRSPTKQQRAKSLIEIALRDSDGIISYQVVQECIHIMLRKFEAKMGPREAAVFLRDILMPLCKVLPGESLFESAIDISVQTGWTFYDSLIVSAATAAQCDILYTEDLQHGRKIRGVQIRNPFA